MKPFFNELIDICRPLPQSPVRSFSPLNGEIWNILIHTHRHAQWQSLIMCCLYKKDRYVDRRLFKSSVPSAWHQYKDLIVGLTAVHLENFAPSSDTTSLEVSNFRAVLGDFREFYSLVPRRPFLEY